MLYEIKNIKRHPGEPKRRWFFDVDVDLTVWFNDKDSIIGFQIVYDKKAMPHALTWWNDRGFSHHRVVNENCNLPNALVKVGPFDKSRISEILQHKAKDIDPLITQAICDKINNFAVLK